MNSKRYDWVLATAAWALLVLPGVATPLTTSLPASGARGGYHASSGYHARYAGPYCGAYYSGYGSYYSNGVIYAPPLEVGVSFDSPDSIAPVTPAPSTTSITPSPAPASPAPTPSAPLPTGVLDVNGYVHSPFSLATVLVPNVRSGQLIYDPTTGQPFRVR